tara:strand:- start:5788 stop:6105 length:318 start_codon:yes stop_codon:yes gene_type:complete
MIDWVIVVLVQLNTGGELLMERHDIENFSYFDTYTECERYIEHVGVKNIMEEVDAILDGTFQKRVSEPFCTRKNRATGKWPEYPDHDWHLTPEDFPLLIEPGIRA